MLDGYKDIIVTYITIKYNNYICVGIKTLNSYKNIIVISNYKGIKYL